MRIATLFLLLDICLFTNTQVHAVPLAVRDICDLLDGAPIVIKGEVLGVHDFQENTSVFGVEDSFLSRGGKTRKAEIRVESVIKGTLDEKTISLLFFECKEVPFTQLVKPHTYILFVADSKFGLKLYDPANGALRVEPGDAIIDQKDPQDRMKRELEASLRSHDEVVLQTVILSFGDIGDKRVRPSLQPFLQHPNQKVQKCAVSACLRLGDWYLATNAATIYEASVSAPDRIDSLGLLSLNPLRSLAMGLSSITNRQAMPLLLDMVRTTTNDSVRSELLKSLAAIADPRAVPLFLEMMDDPRPGTSYLAYRALTAIEGSSSYLAEHAFTGERKLGEKLRLREWAKKLQKDSPK